MRSLILALILAAPLSAQQPTETPAPQRVVVQAGVTERPAPVKIVRVAPPARTSPEGAYEGTRQVRDWRYYATGGPARARANYRVWRTRFAPVHPFRYAPQIYTQGYGHSGRHTPRIYRRW